MTEDELFGSAKPQQSASVQAFFDGAKKRDETDFEKEARQGPSVVSSLGVGLKSFGSNVAGLVDMALGLPAQAIGAGAYMGSRAISKLGDETPKEGAMAAARTKEQALAKIPEWGKAPLAALMRALGYGEDYDESAISKGMETFASWIDKGAGEVERRTSGKLLKEDVANLVDLGMVMMGAKGGDATINALRSNRTPTGAENRGGYDAARVEADRVAAEAKAAADAKVAEAEASARRAEASQAEWTKRQESQQRAVASQQRWAEEFAPKETLRGRSAEGTVLDLNPKIEAAEIPPTTMESAAAKVREGKLFDLTAEERVALRGARQAEDAKAQARADSIIKPDEKTGFLEGGKADPDLLAYLALGTATGMAAWTKYKEWEAGKKDEERLKDLREWRDRKRREEDNYGPPEPRKNLDGNFFAGLENHFTELGLELGAAFGAIKAKGGMWHPEAVTKLSDPLLKQLSNVQHRDVETLSKAAREGINFKEGSDAAKIAAATVWADKAVKNYLNKHAGTETDPLKDVMIPYRADMGRWGELTDNIIEGKKPKQWIAGGARQGEITDLLKIPADETVYGLTNQPPTNYIGRSAKALQDYLSHVGDYLRENVPPEKLQQYDLVRAVKETKKWDEQLAKRMEKERADLTAQMPVYKDYGDGMKWVEVVAIDPKELPKGWRTGQYASGEWGLEVPEGTPRRTEIVTQRFSSKEEAETAAKGFAKSTRTKELLADEGDQMGHCVGGYCNWVESGNSKIYSLRDKEGKAHVTIEVDPAKSANARPGEEPRWADNIVQIKGKQNRAPVERYLPYVQDFVKGGKWEEVGDLENAGLHKLGKGEFVTTAELGRRLDPFYKELERLGIDNNYPPIEQVADRPVNHPGTLLELKMWEQEQARKGGGSQRGSINPQLVKLMAGAGLGALGGALLATLTDKGSEIGAAILGAIGGTVAMSAGGKAALTDAAKGTDKALGMLSTRLKNLSPPIYRRMQQMEMDTLRDVHDVIAVGEPLFIGIEKLGAAGEKINRLLTQNKLDEAAAEIKRVGSPEMAKSLSDLRAVLQYTGEKAKQLGRFKNLNPSYFPRIVRDYKGLQEALGKEAREGLEKRIYEAEKETLRKFERGLTEAERTQIIEGYLKSNPRGSFLPDYAKSRRILDLDDALEPFYAKPVDAYHARMREMVRDLGQVELFGKDRVDMEKGGKRYVDLDRSIAALVGRELEAGNLDNAGAAEVRDLLRARFKGGEKMMSSFLQDAKNLISAGLLGNIVSATGQYADVAPIMFAQEVKPTLRAAARMVMKKAELDPKDFGLINHVSEEFVSSRPTAKLLNWTFSHSVLGKNFSFAGADMNMKKLLMNAALDKGRTWAAKTPEKIREKYGDALGADTSQLIADLKSGEVTPLVREYVWHEITRQQPLSKLEMPQWALENPNGRLLYSMKSWMLKQMDFARREAYDEIRKGNKAQGTKNLLKLGFAYGLGGATLQQVQNWMLGREDKLSAGNIIENAAKTFALNEFTRETAGKGDVVKALIDAGTPPYKIFDDIIKGAIFADDPKYRNKLMRYLPFIGPILYSHFGGGKERYNDWQRKQERAEQLKGMSPQERREDARQRRREKRFNRPVSFREEGPKDLRAAADRASRLVKRSYIA